MLIEPTTERCTECASDHVTCDHDRGELFCEDCGLVLNDNLIDGSPDWIADNQPGMGNMTTGPPRSVLMHDGGLATQIGWSNKDCYGKYIPHNSRAKFYRLRRWQFRARTANIGERELAKGLLELGALCSRIGLPRQIREGAAVIYRKSVAKRLAKGRSHPHLVMASIYASCRQSDVPRTLKELCAYDSADSKAIGRTYRKISRVLGLRFLPTTPDSYISRFCCTLELSQEVQSRCHEILNDVGNSSSGRNPAGTASAAIYMASKESGEPIPQRIIAEVCGVTEVTLRNRMKEMTRGE